MTRGSGQETDVCEQTSVSVVITTRHRAETLNECLQHLQEARDAHVDAVVVDNSDVGRNDTQEVVSAYPWAAYLRVRPCVNYMTFTRNLGVLNTLGEIIGFLDDDSMARPDWFRVCRESFSSRDIGVVGGTILDPQVDDLDHDREAEIGVLRSNGEIIDNFDCRPPRPVDVHHLRGCNWAFLRSAYEALGWYDEFLEGYGFGEVDLSLRVRQVGYRIVFNPKLEVYHKLAPRAKEGRTEISPSRRRHLHRNLSYLYAKNMGLVSMFYLRFLLTYQTHLAATLRSPTPANGIVCAAGVAGKAAGAWKYLKCRRRLKELGTVPRLSSPQYQPLTF